MARAAQPCCTGKGKDWATGDLCTFYLRQQGGKRKICTMVIPMYMTATPILNMIVHELIFNPFLIFRLVLYYHLYSTINAGTILHHKNKIT